MSILKSAAVRKEVTVAGKSLLILDGIDLEVNSGEHVSIIGRSGSGKSTLLHILGLLDQPSSGVLYLDDVPVNSLTPREKARLRGANIGFVFQQFNLFEGRTATENVVAPLFYSTGRDFWHRHEIAATILRDVGLSDRAKSRPGTLSGGEQQRVAVARALVRRPRLILADEPTGALDVETGSVVMDILTSITHDLGSALITITHDPDIAAQADRHYRLDAGKLFAETD